METNEREFNGLLCRPIEQLGVAFADIKIPEGWRIPTLQEGLDLINNDDFVQWSKFHDENHNFYIQQPFNKNEINRASWLFDFGGYSVFGAGGRLVYGRGRVRGVLLVRNK